MIFEPVWISSSEHLQAFQRAYGETSIIRRLLGEFKLPEGFPYVRGFMAPWWRIPLIMTSAGRLRLENRTLSYEATPWELPFSRVYNLRSDWKFVLTAPDITAIEDFEAPSPVARYYNIPFAQRPHQQGRGVGRFLDVRRWTLSVHRQNPQKEPQNSRRSSARRSAGLRPHERVTPKA